MQALASSLEVEPGRLRLTDSLTELFDMDPHAGFHQRATFETWLVERFPRATPDMAGDRIGDLVHALQKLPLR